MSVMRRWRARFAWYDLWIGVFIDRRKRVVYVCPLPTLLLEWRWGTPEPEQPRGAVAESQRLAGWLGHLTDSHDGQTREAARDALRGLAAPGGQ